MPIEQAPSSAAAKQSNKSLNQQISVVAEFHVHKIKPQRIAYRTGIDLHLVEQLINEQCHTALFKRLVNRHKKARREQRLKASLKLKGMARSQLQEKIERDFRRPV